MLRGAEVKERFFKEILAAEERIRPYIRKTYLDRSAYLSGKCDGDVYLKLENLQETGSFKLRGAVNRILSLDESAAERGVVTASTGNHGAAVACALKLTGRDGVIYLPENVLDTKLNSIKSYGGVCRVFGDECGDAETEARRVAEEMGQTYISPYNDSLVVGGQGTVGLELHEQVPEVDAVFVSVGGGGLIGGIGAYLKKVRPEIRLIGCLPVNSPVMYECIKAGRIIDVPCKPTLSDGTAGAVEKGSITFELCTDLVDDYILVEEEEIAEAMRLMIRWQNMLVEGSAAVAVASFLKTRDLLRHKKVAVVICGGNVSIGTVRQILC